MNIKYTLTNDSLAVVLDGKFYTMVSGHPCFISARNAVLAGNVNVLKRAFNVGAMAQVYTHGKVKLANGKLTFAGVELHGALADKVLQFMGRGENYKPLVACLDDLYKNPVQHSREQFFNFIEKHDITITDRGSVLLYKSIRRDNLKDWHSNTFVNKVGATLKTEEAFVTQDPRIGCASGFHCGTLEYAKEFNKGDNQMVVICEVWPRNVRSVPNDSEHQKVRVLEYTVIGEYREKLDSRKVHTSNSLKNGGVNNYHNQRDASGRFTSKTNVKRNKSGRFC
jgi:hypothetical protein